METHVIWIPIVVLLGFVGGLYFLFPHISRRGLLFGVYVGEGAHLSTEARQLTRSWYLHMAAWLAASLVLAVVAGLCFRSPGGGVASIFLLSVGFLVEYLRAYFRARGLASVGPPTTAVAVLGFEERKSPVLPYCAIAAGLVGGLYVIGYAWSHYPQMPPMVPTHFGLTGEPDAWRAKSFSTVMQLPIMSLVMGLGLGGMSYLIGQAKRAIRYRDQGVSFEAQQRFRRVMANFLAVVSLLVTAMMTVLSRASVDVALREAQSLPHAMIVLPISLVVFALGGSIFIAVKYGQGGSQLERTAADAPLTNGLADNRLWVLGIFYVNREDPSLFVERRFGLGYTINFGNPKAVALAVGFIGLVIVIAIVAALAK